MHQSVHATNGESRGMIKNGDVSYLETQFAALPATNYLCPEEERTHCTNLMTIRSPLDPRTVLATASNGFNVPQSLITRLRGEENKNKACV